MKQCHRCGVRVDNDSCNCPLCGAFVNEETAPTVYEYPEIKLKTKKRIWLSICLFFTVLAVGTVAAIDLAVNRNITWSLHVFFGIALIWLCVGRPILKRFNVRKHLSWGFFGAIALLFYLNYQTCAFLPPWALTLGMPIAVLTWQTVLEILIFAHRGGRSDYQVSLTKLCVLSAVFIGVSFLWTKDCGWGWYVCTARGAVDIFALAFFAKDAYFCELKKRLHV